jgi:ABC-type polysaccharide/polyol phosphate transport system ATPase subunit
MPREQVHTLKERVLHPLRRSGEDQLVALRDVSFRVEEGEFFGIVGRNGSGKSTLLKCLAGIYGTNSGDIYINGRLSTFIELGVGFNPDLAAYDNIVLNATMLGLSARDARDRFESVIDFAELHDFTELKLKNYSSGMLVRLAFSVMIQVDAEILLIDEVLAVGDASFQQKCYDQFEKIRASGRTVLFVTHDMGAVRRFCDRAVLLEKGRMVAIGEPESVGNRYLQLNFSAEARQQQRELAASVTPPKATEYMGEEGARFGDGRAEIVEAWVEDSAGKPVSIVPSGERCAIVARVRFLDEIEDPLFSVSLTNSHRHQILSASTVWTTPNVGVFAAGDEVEFRVDFDNILAHDRYFASVSVELSGGHPLDLRERMFSLIVTSTRATGALVEVPHEVRLTRTAREVPL